MVRTGDGTVAGWIGEVHPLVAQAYDLKGAVVAAELDLGVLLAGLRGGARCSATCWPSRSWSRTSLWSSMRRCRPPRWSASLRAAGGELLEDIRVFDLYEGAQVAAGKKSLALRLSFRAPDRTLSEDEVNELRGQMLEKIRGRTGGRAPG